MAKCEVVQQKPLKGAGERAYRGLLPRPSGSAPRLSERRSFLMTLVSFEPISVEKLESLLQSQEVAADTDVAWLLICSGDVFRGDELEEERNIGSLRVRAAVAGARLEPNTLVVLDARHPLKITGSHFDVPSDESERRWVYDSVLSALGEQWGARQLCICISRLHGHGSIGLRAIKRRGGVCLATREAESDQIRHHAPTDLFDHTFAAEQLNDVIAQRLSFVSELRTWTLDTTMAEQVPLIDEIAAAAQEISGREMRRYEPAALLTRAARRMRVRRVSSLKTYLQLVYQDASEAEAFANELDSRCRSFSGPRPFFELEQQLPELISSLRDGAHLRVWVPDCATGEELYCLAILAHEVIERHRPELDLKIFATDRDRAALAYAREGAYPEVVAARIAGEQIDAYFQRNDDGTCRISKAIRQRVVFSVHDLLENPPLAKLDVLAYAGAFADLHADAQRRLLTTFHYSLSVHGYLFFGSAESPEQFENLFVRVADGSRVWQRRAISTPVLANVPARNQPRPRGRAQHLEVAVRPNPIAGLIERMVLNDHAPTCIVFDEDWRVLHVTGKAERFLHPPNGVPLTNLLELLRPELRNRVGGCIDRVVASSGSVRADTIVYGPDRTPIAVSVKALPGAPPTAGWYVLSFDERATADKFSELVIDESRALRIAHDEIARLRAELRHRETEYGQGKRALTDINEELANANAELLACNAELESTQSELSAVNEQLEMINNELRSKVDELAELNGDLHNLFESTRIALIFLDPELRVRSFTPAARSLFNLITTDKGRPLADLTQRFEYPDLHNDIRAVRSELETKEAQVRSSDGRWYMMRMLRYRTGDQVPDGVVITFSDISELKQAELEVQRLSHALEEQLRWLKTLVEVVPVGIGIHEPGSDSVRLNHTAAELVGLTAEPVSQRDTPLPYLWLPEEPATARAAELRAALTLPARVQALEVEFERDTHEKSHVLVHSAPLLDASGVPYAQVSGVLDISESRRAREQAIEREHQQAIIAELGVRALEVADISEFLHESLEAICSGVHAELGDVVRRVEHEEPSRLTLIAAVNWNSDRAAVEEVVEPGSSTALALGHLEPVLLRPEQNEPWPSYLAAEGVSVGARIAIGGRGEDRFGLLGIYRRTPREFTTHELVFLRAIANVITSAIQRKAIEDARVREREAEAKRSSEEQLRRAERLASLGTFAAGIAHEVNNPLASIALSAEFAETAQDPERRAKLLANIRASAHRCGRIVESVLRFAKDEATQKWSNDLNAIIRHATDLVKSYVGSSKLEVELELEEPSPKLRCNPTEIEQVFVNLVQNAAQAHPSRCLVTVRSELRATSVVVKVSDNGPGIPPHDIERIFDPFYSTQRSSGGTGLGLSITHRILTSHGGTIRVSNAPKSGACFEVELPLVDAPPATRAGTR